VPASDIRLQLLSETAYAPADATTLVVHSPSLARDFQIVVHGPPTNTIAGPQRLHGQKLPAIYALDAGWGVAGPIAQMQESVAVLPPVFVISIGYPPGAPDMRNTDLLFRSFEDDGRSIGGGGAAFEAFLTRELRPYLEARFSLDPQRAILFGHSFGGLFAASVIEREPEAWSGYLVASPSTPRGDPSLPTRLAAGAAKGQGRRVFVAVGGDETASGMIPAANAVAASLAGPGSTFRVETHVYANENHISYYPQIPATAFRFMLGQEPALPASSNALGISALERLVGEYVVADGRVTTVTREGEKLFIRITGLPGASELAAQSPTRFTIPSYNVVITFEGDVSAPATALVSSFNGSATRAIRR
jgi:predicted alpha/beta superfamily hydrolase